jgi:hypothetical protein
MNKRGLRAAPDVCAGSPRYTGKRRSAERAVASRAEPRLVPRMADVTDRVEEHFRLFNEAAWDAGGAARCG